MFSHTVSSRNTSSLNQAEVEEVLRSFTLVKVAIAQNTFKSPEFKST